LLLETADLEVGYILCSKLNVKRSRAVVVLLSLVGMCLTVPPKALEPYNMTHPVEALDKFFSNPGCANTGLYGSCMVEVPQEGSPQLAQRILGEVSEVFGSHFVFPKQDELPPNLFHNLPSVDSVMDSLQYNVQLVMQVLISTAMFSIREAVPKATETFVFCRHAPFILSSVVQMYNHFGLQIPIEKAVQTHAPQLFHLLTTDPFQEIMDKSGKKTADKLQKQMQTQVENNFPNKPYITNYFECCLILGHLACWQKLACREGVATKKLKMMRTKTVRKRTMKRNKRMTILIGNRQAPRKGLPPRNTEKNC
jgi:hypothetical protein